MSVYVNIARSGFKVFLAEVLVVILSFLSLTYFARELGSANIGVFFLFQGLLFFISKPADLGTRFAAEKRISEGEHAESFLTTAFLIKAGLLLLTLIGLYTFREHVNAYLGQDLIALLAVALVLQEMGGLMKNVVSGELRVGKTAYLDFTYHFIKYGGGVLLVYAGFGVISLVVSLVVGLLVQALLAFRERNTGFGAPGLEQLYALVEYAKFTIIPSIGTQVYQWLDILIIGLLLNHASVGAYEIAWRVAAPVILLSTAISTTVFPQISAWESEGANEAIERLFSRILTPSLILVFPSLFGTAVLSQEILSLIFGSEYRTAWLTLVVIMAGKIPDSLRSLTGRSLYGLDEPKFVMFSSIVEIAANVVLNVVLILQYGILGAALGTSLSVAIGTAVRTHFLSQFMEIKVPYNELGWCLAASAAMGAILYGAKTMVNIDSVVQLMVFVLTGALVYGFFVSLYSPLRTQIATQLRENFSWPL